MLTPPSSTGSPLQYAVQALVVGEDSAKPTVQQPRLWAAPANVANLAQAPRLSPELVERDALAERLEAGLEDLPDGARTDWSAEAWDVPPHIATARAQPERRWSVCRHSVSPANARPAAARTVRLGR